MTVLYSFIEHKKINGTLFYALEYYALLKKYIPNTKLILFKITDKDLQYVKGVFQDKYNLPSEYHNDIVSLNKYTDIIKLKMDKLLVLDVLTFSKIKDFIGNIPKVFAYSNDEHLFLNQYKNVTFYGWYDYQMYNKKTRLKLYKEIHITYNKKGSKQFLTSPCTSYSNIVNILELDKDNLLIKEDNTAHNSLFKQVNKIIYYHNGTQDTNNRLIVESYIHNIELEVHLNDNLLDSIKDRYSIMELNPNELYLDKNDLMIKDIIGS